MSAGQPQPFARRALLAIWAMATVVLLMVVGLLIYEMARQGQVPFGMGGLAEGPSGPVSEAMGGAPTREIRLYFASRDGRLLVAESRRITPSRNTLENCRLALDALLEGPHDVLTSILPTSAKVRALYLLDDGELVVDFSRELALESRRSASAEALMAYGVANTLAQNALQGAAGEAVGRVRFLVEGAAPEESFPGQGHFDFSRPISPDYDWVMTPAGLSTGDE